MKKKTPRKTRSPKSTKRTIWWAVDVVTMEWSFHKHAYEVLKPIAKALGVQIEPVTVISSADLVPNAFVHAINPEAFMESLQEQLSEGFEREFKKERKGDLLPLRFIVDDTTGRMGTTQQMRLIVREAKKHRSLAVALHTHARTGMKRFFLGSFAETFLLQARIPTITINPATAPSPSIRKVVFPTDFSKESERAFKIFLPIFRSMKAEVIVLHHQHIPSISVFLDEPDFKEQIQAQLEADQIAIELKLTKFVSLARKAKVPARAVFLSENGAPSTADATLKIAKREGADLIALASESGELASAIAGATSREVVRGSTCPVFIHREERR